MLGFTEEVGFGQRPKGGPTGPALKILWPSAQTPLPEGEWETKYQVHGLENQGTIKNEVVGGRDL